MISTSAAYFDAKAKAKEEKRIAKDAAKAAKVAEKAKVRYCAKSNLISIPHLCTTGEGG